MTEMNRRGPERIETLKRIIRQLHEGQGAASEEVKARLKHLVQEVDAGEVAAMEQALMAEGMPVEEIRSMCNLHAEVLQEVMAKPAPGDVPPGHPVDTFRRENDAIRRAVAELRALLEETCRGAGRDPAVALDAVRRAYNGLLDVEKHYLRKENLLFPKLEHHGITGPSKVMWAKHDDVRRLLVELGRTLLGQDLPPRDLIALARSVAEPALAELEGMILKEENVLLPLALETLSEADWAEIWRETPDYGWCLIEPREGYRPPEASAEAVASEVSDGRAVRFPTGTLAADELRGILSAMPLDLTFVDADDRVRYFSEGPDRVFQRSRAVLGRKVQNCHPPSSVHVVERILGDFRSGARDVAEFWIDLQGRFVHIRYFAVRSPEGTYLGTLEAVQDLTRLRSLEGERRLLVYD